MSLNATAAQSSAPAEAGQVASPRMDGLGGGRAVGRAEPAPGGGPCRGLTGLLGQPRNFILKVLLRLPPQVLTRTFLSPEKTAVCGTLATRILLPPGQPQLPTPPRAPVIPAVSPSQPRRRSLRSFNIFLFRGRDGSKMEDRGSGDSPEDTQPGCGQAGV